MCDVSNLQVKEQEEATQRLEVEASKACSKLASQGQEHLDAIDALKRKLDAATSAAQV